MPGFELWLARRAARRALATPEELEKMNARERAYGEGLLDATGSILTVLTAPIWGPFAIAGKLSDRRAKQKGLSARVTEAEKLPTVAERMAALENLAWHPNSREESGLIIASYVNQADRLPDITERIKAYSFAYNRTYYGYDSLCGEIEKRALQAFEKGRQAPETAERVKTYNAIFKFFSANTPHCQEMRKSFESDYLENIKALPLTERLVACQNAFSASPHGRFIGEDRRSLVNGNATVAVYDHTDLDKILLTMMMKDVGQLPDAARLPAYNFIADRSITDGPNGTPVLDSEFRLGILREIANLQRNASSAENPLPQKPQGSPNGRSPDSYDS